MFSSSNTRHHREILFQDGDNKVIYCYDCQSFNIRYGTISINLLIPGLEILEDTLYQYLNKYDGKVHPDCRCIEVDTPYRGIRILLSISDIHKFGAMLRTAYLALEKKCRNSRYN